MNDEILRLARRCNILGGKVLPPACDEGVETYWVEACSIENLEAFYKAAYNKAVADAVDAIEG